jgi:hypothetical protein
MWKKQAHSLAHAQIAALLQRDPASQVTLTHPSGVPKLLNALQEVAAIDQLTVLANRAAAGFAFDDSHPHFILERLREVGAIEQADALTERFIAEGRAFLVEALIRDDQARLGHGREPDGSDAAPWTWDDL